MAGEYRRLSLAKGYKMLRRHRVHPVKAVFGSIAGVYEYHPLAGILNK